MKHENPQGFPGCDSYPDPHVYFQLDAKEAIPIAGVVAHYEGKHVITSEPIMYSGHTQNHTLLAWANVRSPCPGYFVSDLKLAVLSYR